MRSTTDAARPRAGRKARRANTNPGLNARAIGLTKGVSKSGVLDIIREHSIFLQLKRAGIDDITFANTYTQRFFDSRPRWISATTAAVEAGGLRFNTVSDLQAGRAVYQDFTNAMLVERGETVDLRSPEGAARCLANIVAANRFTLYEYSYGQDRARQDHEAARRVLRCSRLLFVRCCDA